MASVRLWFVVGAALVACHARERDPAPAVVETGTVESPITWPQSADTEARAALWADGTRHEHEIDAALARASVPVLAPRARRLERPSLVVRDAFVALTFRTEGTTVALQGTRKAKVLKNVSVPPPQTALRGTHGYVSVNEGVRTASWIENGASYMLTVECASPTDALCRDDRFALEIVESLVYVGGAGR